MDPYRCFYESHYNSPHGYPQPGIPPQASQTGQISLSPPVLTPASNEVTGYPPPLDMNRAIPDGSPIPASPYYTGDASSRQYRPTSVTNPALNGLASFASTYSPPSTSQSDLEYGEDAIRPPAHDNPFYPRPLDNNRPASAHRSTLPRLRPQNGGRNDYERRYAPESYRTSFAPEISRGQSRYYQEGGSRRSRTHNAPSPDSRSYERPGYEGSYAEARPSVTYRFQSWLENIAPGSPQEPASQPQTHHLQSRYNPSSAHTTTYCLNCKTPLTQFRLRCGPCLDRHTDRLNGLDSSWEPAHCIRCKDAIGEAYILCERHKQDLEFFTPDQKRTLERQGICCYCWIERAEQGSDRCSTCRTRSRQWIGDGAEVGLQREVCIRCERRTTSQPDGICGRCMDYERRRRQARR
ncbi:hypothetical protein ACHAQK_008050 [Fusarium lateritium]